MFSNSIPLSTGYNQEEFCFYRWFSWDCNIQPAHEPAARLSLSGIQEM